MGSEPPTTGWATLSGVWVAANESPGAPNPITLCYEFATQKLPAISEALLAGSVES